MPIFMSLWKINLIYESVYQRFFVYLQINKAFFCFNAKQCKIRNFARFQIVSIQAAILCKSFVLSKKEDWKCLEQWKVMCREIPHCLVIRRKEQLILLSPGMSNASGDGAVPRYFSRRRKAAGRNLTIYSPPVLQRLPCIHRCPSVSGMICSQVR